METQIGDQRVTRANAYRLLDDVCGLLRTVEELRNSHGDMAEYQKTALMAKVNDERRWLQFVIKFKLK